MVARCGQDVAALTCDDGSFAQRQIGFAVQKPRAAMASHVRRKKLGKRLCHVEVGCRH